MRRALIVSIVCWGCGSGPQRAPAWRAGLDDPNGERGLAGLRTALDAYPSVGHVERGPSGTVLVHEASGARLALSDAGTCTTERDGPTLLFEGAPGAALAFHGEVVHAYWRDAAKGCLVRSELAKRPTYTTDEELAWVDEQPEDDVDEEGNPLEPVKTALGAREDAITVDLEPTEVSIRVGDALVHHETFVGEHCEFSTSVSKGELGDGVVLRVSRETSTLVKFEDGVDCTSSEEQGDVFLVETDSETIVLITADGEATVVSEVSNDSNPASYSTDTFSVPVVNGRLEFDATTHINEGREGPMARRSWSWSFVATGGKSLTLATGGER